ncbi:MAG: PAC2 family protein [Nanoarchaeota archaeon]
MGYIGENTKMGWIIKSKKNSKPKSMVLIEGLPGIGSVGKIAVDFLIDDLKAEKIASFYSTKLPHLAFVNEDNIVELPSIEIYKKVIRNKTLFFIAGDVQPLDEVSCYEFCEEVLKLCKQNNCEEIITLGGIGLRNIPKNPKVYCTGNDKNIIKRYKGYNVLNNINKLSGPIIGVNGVLVGLAKNFNIAGVSILAETYGHPAYFGLKGARALLNILDKRFRLGLNFRDFGEEAKRFRNEFDLPKLDKKIKEINVDKEQDGKIGYIG